MQGSFKVGTIGGIHYTWIFAVLLIAWWLALGYFPSASQGRGAGTDWLPQCPAASSARPAERTLIDAHH